MRQWLRALFRRKPLYYGPQGVSLLYDDGTQYDDVPSVYVGVDERGCSIYELLAPRDNDLPIDMLIRIIPPMTTVVFPFKGMPKTTDPTIEVGRVEPEENA